MSDHVGDDSAPRAGDGVPVQNLARLRAVLDTTYVRADQIVDAAFGDGVTNATSHIQGKIDACPEGGTVFVPTGLYKLTSALSITKSVTIRGEGCSPVFGTAASGLDCPTASPFLRGTVLLPSTAATNAINITGTGKSVNIENMGIRFADAIRHVNTGHGIYAVPTATSGSGHESGLVGSTWRNVRVFGHDGNHYALYLVNPLLCTFMDLASYGGGIVHVECDSYAGNYGNLAFINSYGDVYCGGTAHGYHLVSRTGSGSAGLLNLITMVRPQAITESQTGPFPETTAPTSAQYLFKANDAASTNNLTVIQQDMETGVSSLCDFGTGVKWIDPAGLITVSTDAQSKAWLRTPPPTVAAGAGAGTSPAASTISGDDYRGTIVMNIGTSPPAAGQNLLFVSWSAAKSPAFIGLQATDQYSAALGLYVGNVTSAGFGIRALNAPAPSGQYNLTYQVVR